MIIKISFLVVASIAAYAVSQKNSNSTRKQLDSAAIKPPENDGSNFQQQQNEGEMEDEEAAEIFRSKQMNSLSEIELLVKELQQRKVRLENKLLELCVLKEEQSYMAHSQRHMEDKSAEIGMLNVTIASLQAERKVLQEDAKQCVLAKKQLEMAKKMIAEMQKKMDSNESSIMKGRLLVMEEQVSSFPKDEISVRDAIAEKKLKAVKNVELEVLTMKRRNKELELEKRELAVKLVSAQARISTLSSMTEIETVAKVEEEISRLRHTNEDLSRQFERLQKNKFEMVQERVYQRWLYTSLRFETQIHNSSSHKSHEKNEPLISSNPSYDSPSSHTSSTSLSDEIETTTIDSSSSSSQRNVNKKSGFIHRIKRWGRSKDESDAISLSDRSSGGNSLSKKGLRVLMNSTQNYNKIEFEGETQEEDPASSPEVSVPATNPKLTKDNNSEIADTEVGLNKKSMPMPCVDFVAEKENELHFSLDHPWRTVTKTKPKPSSSNRRESQDPPTPTTRPLQMLPHSYVDSKECPEPNPARRFLDAPRLRRHSSPPPGLTVTAAIMGLILFTPLIIISSPIWVPIGALLFLTVAGFVSMCGFGAAAVAGSSWMYRYFKGMHPPGSDRVDYARSRIYDTASHVKDYAREYGGYLHSKVKDAAPGA
ncbi:protein CHUP1 chloroplastic [Prunus yedoensis var. nudiflora]|uniref:Protein CHUP1 chloroplastic n=1 Tax=Prunus yedoensis var. nudiflora TaxID=2094558 RepID=A0A314XPL0_PRUYE|nr:protein CHUP1 chloroplastic [Prunus yedoensis var. nudiflora]